MEIPSHLIPKIEALIAADNQILPIKVGTLTFDEDKWIYDFELQGEDGRGMGKRMIANVGVIDGALYTDASDTD